MTRQSKKLLIMLILGLPGLIPACLSYLVDRYIAAYHLPPEQRFLNGKEPFIALMLAYTITGLLFGVPIYLLSRCK